jgi:hypothetical protein
LQDKKQTGRTAVTKPGGVEHIRTGPERSASFSRTTYSHAACQEEACPEILHVTSKYHPYKMQVLQRMSKTDRIISLMHHLDLVMCNGYQGHVTSTATDFFSFKNYIREVFV